MSSKFVSRIAPTPSGWLHFGNIANFLLIEKIIKNNDGKLILRIDDCDNTRTRKEFVEHIFLVLKYLGIEYHCGPKNILDFEENFSQTTRASYYFDKLQDIGDRIYACECSRKELGNGIYPGTCREKKIRFIPGEHSLRLRSDSGKFGDVIVWRKDNGPAYHWVSVIDDLDHQVNLIVRGDDLKESTELQMIMARILSEDGFSKVRFFHHPLLNDSHGEKLSKTNKSASILDLMNKNISADEMRADLAKIVDPWYETFKQSF